MQVFEELNRLALSKSEARSQNNQGQLEGTRLVRLGVTNQFVCQPNGPLPATLGPREPDQPGSAVCYSVVTSSCFLHFGSPGRCGY